jgi:ribonucleoside-diphosphate reductase beta chain
MAKYQMENVEMEVEQIDSYPFKIRDKVGRSNIYPIVNKKLFKYYTEKARPCTWFVEDIKGMDQDIKDWETKLTPEQKHFIEFVLTFFSAADDLVMKNISCNFSEEIDIKEAQHFYAHQLFIESIHAEAYGLFIQTYIKDQKKVEKIMNRLQVHPAIQSKYAWVDKYMNRDNARLVERLVAFAIIEGVFFSASFASIFYFRSKKLLPALCVANEYIARDEGLHCEFACMLYSYVKQEYRLTQEKIEEIFDAAVQTEIEFVVSALPVGLIGLSTEMMIDYVKYIADFWIKKLGYKPMYGIKSNPIDFMSKISLKKTTNFFEDEDTNYHAVSKPKNFTLDASF